MSQNWRARIELNTPPVCELTNRIFKKRHHAFLLNFCWVLAHCFQTWWARILNFLGKHPHALLLNLWGLRSLFPDLEGKDIELNSHHCYEFTKSCLKNILTLFFWTCLVLSLFSEIRTARIELNAHPFRELTNKIFKQTSSCFSSELVGS